MTEKNNHPAWIENLDPEMKKLYLADQLQDVPQGFIEKARIIYDRRLRQEALVPEDAVSAENPPKQRYDSADYEQTTDARYLVGGKLGEGSFGAVYDVYDLKLQDYRAMKQYVEIPFFEQNEKIKHRAMIEREAKTMGSLRHKNLPFVYDYFLDDNKPTFIMEKFDPKEYHTLSSVEVQTAEMIVKIFAQMCDVVAYCHSEGVHHRDLKPSNILVNTAGDVKVLDFGISNWAVEGNSSLGALRYSSPERQRRLEKYDELKSEIFTLGTILYELVTGKRLYKPAADDSGSFTLLRVTGNQKLNDEEQVLFRKKAQEKGFDAEKLLEVLEKSHSREPEDRFDSPEAFALAVEDARANLATASS